MKKVKAKKKQGMASTLENRPAEEAGKPVQNSETAVISKGKEKVKKTDSKEEPSEGLVSRWTGKIGWIGQVKDFLREVRIELRKVTWPTRKETIAATSMVIGLSIVVAFILGVLDVGLAKVVDLILRR
ncbi:MAG: preprotein translocase subunit SecE [Thermodesulfobacteriota bacterium]